MRNKQPILERFQGLYRVCEETGCHLWKCPTKSGYAQFSVRKGVSAWGHRWIWQYVHGEIPSTLKVRHTCGQHNCVNVEHLTIKVKRATIPASARKQSTNRILSIDKAQAIRSKRTAGSPMKDLALEFNVDISMVSLVVNNKRWPVAS